MVKTSIHPSILLSPTAPLTPDLSFSSLFTPSCSCSSLLPLSCPICHRARRGGPKGPGAELFWLLWTIKQNPKAQRKSPVLLLSVDLRDKVFAAADQNTCDHFYRSVHEQINWHVSKFWRTWSRTSEPWNFRTGANNKDEKQINKQTNTLLTRSPERTQKTDYTSYKITHPIKQTHQTG